MSSGGTEIVSSGGSAIATTVSSGGLEFVFSGGLATSTVIDDGGDLVVLPGGMASATDSAGGLAISTGVVFDQPGTGVTVYATAATDLTVASGEIVDLLNSGTTTGTTVQSGGFEFVYSGARR